jgi:hypothetical protein
LKEAVMAVLDPTKVSDEATRLGVEVIAGYLQAQLGQKLTAYLAGVTDPKMVGRWAAGKAQPRDEREMRLRDAFKATRMIVDAFGPTTAKAWWVGSNTRLDDEAPAAVVRHARDPEGLRFVVPAARAFAGGPA